MAIIADLSPNSKKEISDALTQITNDATGKVIHSLLPTAKLQINKNGTYNVKHYGYVNVDVIDNHAINYSDITLDYDILKHEGKNCFDIKAIFSDKIKSQTIPDDYILKYVKDNLLKDCLDITREGTFDVSNYKSISVNLSHEDKDFSNCNQLDLKNYVLNAMIRESNNHEKPLINEEDIHITGVFNIDSIPYILCKVGKAEKKFYISSVDAGKIVANVQGLITTNKIDLENTDLKINIKTGFHSNTENDNMLELTEHNITLSSEDLIKLYRDNGYNLQITKITEDDVVQQDILLSNNAGHPYHVIYSNGIPLQQRIKELQNSGMTINHVVYNPKSIINDYDYVLICSFSNDSSVNDSLAAETSNNTSLSDFSEVQPSSHMVEHINKDTSLDAFQNNSTDTNLSEDFTDHTKLFFAQGQYTAGKFADRDGKQECTGLMYDFYGKGTLRIGEGSNNNESKYYFRFYDENGTLIDVIQFINTKYQYSYLVPDGDSTVEVTGYRFHGINLYINGKHEERREFNLSELNNATIQIATYKY